MADALAQREIDLQSILTNGWLITEDLLDYIEGRGLSCPEPTDETAPSCGMLQTSFAIRADGVVAPCMSMAESAAAEKFPNLMETPLREILRHPVYLKMAGATVGEVRGKNPGCAECAHKDICFGGCRFLSLYHGNGYFGIDPVTCHFFKSGWYRRVQDAARQ